MEIIYVRELAVKLGSKRSAAKYLGCTSSTIQHLCLNNAVFIDGVLYIQSSSRAKLPGGDGK